ncbi:hypothetical protein SAMN05216311_11614 [Chitinophaga sp. CF418]|nr:hypothetical protein SAMN05216311_11614 [Chitinophaga sp. CF418]
MLRMMNLCIKTCLECRRTISLYSNEDIYFDIIDNDKVNAVAGKLDGSYYIGIYRGAIRVFDSLARKIASHPEILVDFGDPSKETNSNKIYNANKSATRANFLFYINWVLIYYHIH